MFAVCFGLLLLIGRSIAAALLGAKSRIADAAARIAMRAVFCILTVRCDIKQCVLHVVQREHPEPRPLAAGGVRWSEYSVFGRADGSGASHRGGDRVRVFSLNKHSV